jgi:hypothetical protein
MIIPIQNLIYLNLKKHFNFINLKLEMKLIHLKWNRKNTLENIKGLENKRNDNFII